MKSEEKRKLDVLVFSEPLIIWLFFLLCRPDFSWFPFLF